MRRSGVRIAAHAESVAAPTSKRALIALPALVALVALVLLGTSTWAKRRCISDHSSEPPGQ